MRMNFISLLFAFTLFLPNESSEGESSTEMYDVIEVTATTYSPSVKETDSTPLVTASGFKINPKNPKRHRIIAVSRDLKKKYKFGTKVKVSGAGKYNGEYVVRDVMNKRYKKRIDILIGSKDKQTKISKVKIRRVS
jgi:3D (Asp-Asp-Asp) domain-containing protein